MPKRALRVRAAGEPAVQYRLRQIFTPIFVEQVGDAVEIEHEVADRDASLTASLANRKDPERQVLDGKVAAAARSRTN